MWGFTYKCDESKAKQSKHRDATLAAVLLVLAVLRYCYSSKRNLPLAVCIDSDSDSFPRMHSRTYTMEHGVHIRPVHSRVECVIWILEED
jgi:hypothetical protein